MQHSHYGNKYLEKIAVDWGSIAYQAGKHTKGIRKALSVGEDVQ